MPAQAGQMAAERPSRRSTAPRPSQRRHACCLRATWPIVFQQEEEKAGGMRAAGVLRRGAREVGNREEERLIARERDRGEVKRGRGRERERAAERRGEGEKAKRERKREIRKKERVWKAPHLRRRRPGRRSLWRTAQRQSARRQSTRGTRWKSSLLRRNQENMEDERTREKGVRVNWLRLLGSTSIAAVLRQAVLLSLSLSLSLFPQSALQGRERSERIKEEKEEERERERTISDHRSFSLSTLSLPLSLSPSLLSRLEPSKEGAKAQPRLCNSRASAVSAGAT